MIFQKKEERFGARGEKKKEGEKKKKKKKKKKISPPPSSTPILLSLLHLTFVPANSKTEREWKGEI